MSDIASTVNSIARLFSPAVTQVLRMQVEVALARVQARRGIIPAAAAEEIARTANLDSVPPEAVVTRHGVDYVRVATPGGPLDVAVILGETFRDGDQPRVEVLTGLRDGDRVVLPGTAP